MAHQRADTKTLMLSVIEEYSHSDMALGPQIRSMHSSDDDAVEKTLLIMAHAHIHSAIALLKKAGESQRQVAEDLYVHADIQATKGSGL